MTLDEQIERIQYEINLCEEESRSLTEYEWLFDVIDSLNLLKNMQEG